MPVRKKEPEDLAAKKELALEVIRRLKAEYPDAGCTLDYDHAWQLLVSVRLAAQCTDARVNIVVEELFAKYPSVAALAAAEPEDIEAIVKPCGLGHSKARDISACMRMLRDKYDCRVPDTFDELLALPGVGRKSANLIMGDVFGKPAIVTDTHCIRLCNKIGLVDGIKEPQKVACLVDVVKIFLVEFFLIHSPDTDDACYLASDGVFTNNTSKTRFNPHRHVTVAIGKIHS